MLMKTPASNVLLEFPQGTIAFCLVMIIFMTV